uniref:Cytochrome n=1 Tax=Lutzomyia longipalpis TaxID=7200 RepID=A0A1B0CRK3_LUTLO
MTVSAQHPGISRLNVINSGYFSDDNNLTSPSFEFSQTLPNSLVVIIGGSGFLIYSWSMRKFQYWKDRGIAYVEPEFPYGNTKGVSRDVRFSDILTSFYNRFSGREKFVGMYIFMRPIGMAIDPELVKKILVKDFHNFQDRGLYHNEKDDPLSGHLFTLEGEPWRVLRTKLSPTFTSGKIKMMFNIMVEVTSNTYGV